MGPPAGAGGREAAMVRAAEIEVEAGEGAAGQFGVDVDRGDDVQGGVRVGGAHDRAAHGAEALEDGGDGDGGGAHWRGE